MNFGKMVKELLCGKPMKRVDWPDDYCIKIKENGNTTDVFGFPYTFSKSDYESEWQIYDPIKAGTLLYDIDSDGNKSHYRIVEDGDKYDIINTSNWSVRIKNISKDSLKVAIYAYDLEKENVAEKDDKGHGVFFSDNTFE